jgi:hypothetical protein
LKEARSRLPQWKFLHIKHSQAKQASPVAGMKVQRYRRKIFLTTVKTMSKQQIVLASGIKCSHINTIEIHPAYRGVSLKQDFFYLLAYGFYLEKNQVGRSEKIKKKTLFFTIITTIT